MKESQVFFIEKSAFFKKYIAKKETMCYNVNTINFRRSTRFVLSTQLIPPSASRSQDSFRLHPKAHSIRLSGNPEFGAFTIGD